MSYGRTKALMGWLSFCPTVGQKQLNAAMSLPKRIIEWLILRALGFAR